MLYNQNMKLKNDFIKDKNIFRIRKKHSIQANKIHFLIMFIVPVLIVIYCLIVDKPQNKIII